MTAPRRPLRIAHVIPQIGVGGAELQLGRLVSGSPPARLIHTVHFYRDSRDDEGYAAFRRMGVDFRRVSASRWNPAGLLLAIGEALRAQDPDIVHCWLVSAAFWGHWAAVIARRPRIVLAFRSTHVDLASTLRLSHRLHHRGIHYLANSRAVARAVSDHIGPPLTAITVIPNGADPAPPHSTRARQSLLDAHGCPPGTRVATMVARLTQAKNHPMLLRLASLCRGHIPVHFFIAGHGEDEVALREHAHLLGVEDCVHFLGLHRDVATLLSASDVFIYTSRFEGFPNALLEASAAGLPVITTAFAGVEEIVGNGTTGIVVPQEDELAAFAALRDLLGNPGRLAAMARAARETAESRFSTRRMVEDFAAFYERIVAG